MKQILENKKNRYIFIALIVLILFILSNIIYFTITAGINTKKMSDEELLTYCLELNDEELTELLTSIDRSEATRAMNLINAYQVLEAVNEDTFTNDSNSEASVQEAVNALNEVKEHEDSNNENSNEITDNFELSDEEAQKLIEDGILVPLE